MESQRQSDRTHIANRRLRRAKLGGGRGDSASLHQGAKGFDLSVAQTREQGPLCAAHITAGLNVRLGIGRADCNARTAHLGQTEGQGKGWDFALYANETMDALAAYPRFARQLQKLPGIDVTLGQSEALSAFT